MRWPVWPLQHRAVGVRVMSGWSDWIFGNLPPPPKHPASRGALLGANSRAMPDARATVTDERQLPFDHAYWMTQAPSTADSQFLGESKVYRPSMQFNSARSNESDSMLLAANTLDPNQPADVAPYQPSFQPNWRPPASVPAQPPYRNFPVGPIIPRGYDPSAPYDAGGYQASGYQLPYIGPHLPISPGDPGWTPPPSPSGPHNLQGDPARPGYDRPGFSVGASQLTPDQMTNALRAWGGWQ
jgi:hypothetical protein